MIHPLFTTIQLPVQPRMRRALRSAKTLWNNPIFECIDRAMASEDIRDILDKLLKRRDEIIKEAAALDNLISLYKGLSREAKSESLFDEVQLSFYAQPSSRAAQALEINRTIEAARKLMIKEGRPMKRGEIVNILKDQGFSFPGKDKNKVFGTNLWRSGKFRTVGDKGYWPKDVVLPK